MLSQNHQVKLMAFAQELNQQHLQAVDQNINNSIFLKLLFADISLYHHPHQDNLLHSNFHLLSTAHQSHHTNKSYRPVSLFFS
ncbi:Uncharacterised protein [Yersinia similis]|nr:Uncharacterised protein [Yersinia similis]